MSHSCSNTKCSVTHSGFCLGTLPQVGTSIKFANPATNLTTSQGENTNTRMPNVRINQRDPWWHYEKPKLVTLSRWPTVCLEVSAFSIDQPIPTFPIHCVKGAWLSKFQLQFVASPRCLLQRVPWSGMLRWDMTILPKNTGIMIVRIQLTHWSFFSFTKSRSIHRDDAVIDSHWMAWIGLQGKSNNPGLLNIWSPEMLAVLLVLPDPCWSYTVNQSPVLIYTCNILYWYLHYTSSI